VVPNGTNQDFRTQAKHFETLNVFGAGTRGVHVFGDMYKFHACDFYVLQQLFGLVKS